MSDQPGYKVFKLSQFKDRYDEYQDEFHSHDAIELSIDDAKQDIDRSFSKDPKSKDKSYSKFSVNLSQ